MGYALLSSYDTVQVLGPTLAVDAIYCTIGTSGSGSIVNRTVPKTSFDTDNGAGLLNSLADAVDNAISGGLAVGASGSQGVDESGLIFDAVTFTVEYVPPGGSAGAITTTVDIPVDVLTADTQFGSFLSGGGSASDRLSAAYDRLKALAGG